MKSPCVASMIERNGMKLFRALVFEVYEAIELLNKTPKFVDNPLGLRLRDIEANVDLANDFLFNVLAIASEMVDGKFIKEEGG